MGATQQKVSSLILGERLESEIEAIAQTTANSRAATVRVLLAEAIAARKQRGG